MLSHAEDMLISRRKQLRFLRKQLARQVAMCELMTYANTISIVGVQRRSYLNAYV